MRTHFRHALALLLVVVCILAGSFAVFAQTAAEARTAALAYIAENVKTPIVNAVGGEWAILALARGNAEVQTGYYSGYVDRVKQALRGNGGVLPGSASRKTEYSRAVIALSALGEDVTNFDGYDLLLPLAHLGDVTAQGVNGAIYALIAFDTRNWAIPAIANTAQQTTRQKLVDYILGKEVPSGGFARTGTTVEVDITAMALQALAPYRTDPAYPDVAPAIENALNALSDMQAASGGFDFETEGEASESAAQVITALAALGIDAAADADFTKANGNALSALLKFQQANGGFYHVAAGTGSMQMATEQAACALVAYDRMLGAKNRLFDMGDVPVQLAADKAAKLTAINAIDDGLSEALYTPVSWAALQNAIAQAVSAVNAAATITQANAVEVPSASGLATKAKELSDAKGAKITAILAVTAGLKQSDYTADSWAALQNEMAKAIAAANAATAIEAINAVAVPSRDVLVTPAWWESPPLPGFLHWILRYLFFGWIWMR